jgi:chorismate mutase
MQIKLGNLAVFVAFAIGATDIVLAQDAIDKLQPLVEASARRLALAEQVALAKWDSHTPVEDAPREAQVILGAVMQGESKGLDGTFVSKFFRAQIEANKTVQYFLLADWYRAGKAPAHLPINLAATIRPEVDHLQTALIAALADTVIIRAGTTCHTDIARAVGRYVSAHAYDARSLHTVALDRSLAAACTS